MIERMAAAARAELPEDRRARKRQIANGVEHLVAHEFVAEAQALRIDDAGVRNGDRILERCAQRESRLPQPLDVGEEAESARARQFAAEGRRIEPQRLALMADGGVVEVDLDVEGQAALAGRQFGECAAPLHAHGLENFDMPALRRQHGQTRLVDRGDEGGRRAVENRRFRPVDLHQSIVDAQTGQSRHGVFDGRNRIAAAEPYRRAEFGRDDARPEGGRDRLGGEIGAHEDDARIGFRRMQRDTRGLGGMDAKAVERNGRGKSGLQLPGVSAIGLRFQAFGGFDTGHPASSPSELQRNWPNALELRASTLKKAEHVPPDGPETIRAGRMSQITDCERMLKGR